MKGLQERHREIIGDDGAGETVLAPQELAQKRFISGNGHAVDVGIAVHNRPGPVPERHFERREHDVGQLPAPDRDRSEVPPGPRRRVANEVFEGGDHARRLEASHVRAPDRAHQERVFPDGLFHPPPAQVAYDVEHGGQTLVHTQLAHRGADLAPICSTI